MLLNLTAEQKQALYCGSDWKLPPDLAGKMNQVLADYEREAIAAAGLPVSEYQYSHCDTGTVVISNRDTDAVAQLKALRERYAAAQGWEHHGWEVTGEDVFRLAEGWTSGGDMLAWVRLNGDVVLGYVGHEVYAGNEQLRWAVVAKFDPRTSEKPLSVTEAQELRALAQKLKQSPGRPRTATNPKSLAQQRWRDKRKGL
jgi:hypothetical protein